MAMAAGVDSVRGTHVQIGSDALVVSYSLHPCITLLQHRASQLAFLAATVEAERLA